jgi:hypothetical protein
LFFEIYDTWGDGIYAPNGCEVYVDGTLVYSGANDIGLYASTILNCSDSCVLVLDALNDLQDHINANFTLSPNDLTYIKTIFTLFPECLASSEANILLSKSVVEDYDNVFGAMFTTPNTQNGFYKDPIASPGMELERAMIALQQGILDQIFTSDVYDAFPQHINGWKYGACTTFPGFVAPPADSTIGVSVPIRANFEDPDGMNPYYEINGDGTDHALRPTGLYLSPGSVATVTVPDSLVGQDYWIRVGSHDWDLTNRDMFLRFDRISKKFLINSNTIEVFNPLGGAISILVPYGADDGIVQVSVNNGVEAPFFSLKSFYETTDFNAELSKPGPWAVFETDNVMFTIPKHSIVPGQYNLMQAMQDWETALRGMNSILARQIIPDKHNMYMISDVDIRVGVYSIGYPNLLVFSKQLILSWKQADYPNRPEFYIMSIGNGAEGFSGTAIFDAKKNISGVIQRGFNKIDAQMEKDYKNGLIDPYIYNEMKNGFLKGSSVSISLNIDFIIKKYLMKKILFINGIFMSFLTSAQTTNGQESRYVF